MTGKVNIISDDAALASITINGNGPYVQVGGSGKHGAVSATDDNGNVRAYLSGGSGRLSIAEKSSAPGVLGHTKFLVSAEAGFSELGLWPTETAGTSGDLHFATVHLRGSDAVIRAGGAGHDGRVLVLEKNNTATITLDGAHGDIVLANADCAEDFDVVELDGVEPGSVMVLSADGALALSSIAYDRRVAGVVSGGGGYRPGIVLDRAGTGAPRLPVALVGKVFCKVEADSAAITPGDLLTTSAIPGHAMRATDPARAFGAVLGKALRGLANGRGMIPILVALQ